MPCNMWKIIILNNTTHTQEYICLYINKLVEYIQSRESDTLYNKNI